MHSYKQPAIANTGLEPVNPRSRILCLTIWLIRNLVLPNDSTERGKNRLTQKIGLKMIVKGIITQSQKCPSRIITTSFTPLILNTGDLESATRRPFSQNR